MFYSLKIIINTYLSDKHRISSLGITLFRGGWGVFNLRRKTAVDVQFYLFFPENYSCAKDLLREGEI